MKESPSKKQSQRAQRYLDQVENSFYFDKNSGFYLPNIGERIEDSVPEKLGSSERFRFFTDPKEGTWTLLLSALTLLLVMATAFFTGKQLQQSIRATTATEQAAYAACISAQISQSTLREVHRSGLDAHNSAIASVYQAMAATQTETANLSLFMLPLRVKVGETIGFPFYVKNVGNGVAKNVTFQGRAVFLARSSDADFSYPDNVTSLIKVSRLEGGEKMSANWDDTNRVMFLNARAQDETQLTASQQDLNDFNSGKMDAEIFGRIGYEDGFGIRHEDKFCYTSARFASSTVIDSGHKRCVDYNKTSTNKRIASVSGQPPTAEAVLPSIDCTAPSTKSTK